MGDGRSSQTKGPSHACAWRTLSVRNAADNVKAPRGRWSVIGVVTVVWRGSGHDSRRGAPPRQGRSVRPRPRPAAARRSRRWGKRRDGDGCAGGHSRFSHILFLASVCRLRDRKGRVGRSRLCRGTRRGKRRRCGNRQTGFGEGRAGAWGDEAKVSKGSGAGTILYGGGKKRRRGCIPRERVVRIELGKK